MKLALVALLAPAIAAADPVALPKTKAMLDVPSTWSKLEQPSLVVAYRSPSGIVLAVTRAAVPNPNAWRAKTRDAYLDRITRGAVAAVTGQKQLARRITEAGGVPALDLELRRDDGSTLVMRILVFRTYALAATLEVPKGTPLDDARRITAKFAPPSPRT